MSGSGCVFNGPTKGVCAYGDGEKFNKVPGHDPAFFVQMTDYDGNTFDAAVCNRCGVVYVPEVGE